MRVLVISEQPIIRFGVECLLGHPDIFTFFEDPAVGKADVVIYDVIGLHLNDGDDLRLAVERHPGRVLALSRSLQPGLTARALDLGAVAAISIGIDAEELRAIIRLTVDGHLEDGSPADLANRREREHFLGHDRGLTCREREVLALIVAGVANEDIALQLHLTENTVKSKIRSAYAKIGATTRAQAVAWGVEHGFPTTRPGR